MTPHKCPVCEGKCIIIEPEYTSWDGEILKSHGSIKVPCPSCDGTGIVWENRDEHYTYSTIEDYEDCVGHQVNEAFRIGWDMARTTNRQLNALFHSEDKEI